MQYNTTKRKASTDFRTYRPSLTSISTVQQIYKDNRESLIAKVIFYEKHLDT